MLETDRNTPPDGAGISAGTPGQKSGDETVRQSVEREPDLTGHSRRNDDSIIEEIGHLIDDAGLYASAEIAFQKTRAKLAARSIGFAAASILLAVILLHIALIALAVGFVIALQPLVTIWGAIAIVVGIMLAGVIALGLVAASKARLIGELFKGEPDESGSQAVEDNQ